jgi:hypothetical protein
VPSESPNEGAFTQYNTNEEITGPPEYLSPVLDPGVVSFIPYRGQQFHGVHPPQMITPQQGEEELPDDAVITGLFEPPTEDANPVPVRIVDTAAHEYSQWRAWQAIVDTATPRLVANKKEGQSSIQIKSLASGSDRVWIGPDAGVSHITGYPLDPGGEVTLSGEAPVYAVAGTGTVTVALLSQFSTAQ